MERITIKDANNLFGNNFLGPDQLTSFLNKIGGKLDNIKIPPIDYSKNILESYAKKGFILILGIDRLDDITISLEFLRRIFGIDPEIQEPCFYNQDWYVTEDFIRRTLEFRWYLIKKDVVELSRAKQPGDLILKNGFVFPSAILCAYTFFAYYFSYHKYLWEYDFVWCNDLDHNGDRIYIGKYRDIDGVNKNGFSIHRHLSLRECYGAITLV